MAYPSALSYLDEPPPDTLDSLPAAPAPLSPFQQDVNAVPPPQLEPLPADYVPAEYKPGGIDAFAEDYAAGLGNLQLSRPRSVGQGILLGLSGALAGRGARVARARQNFEQHEAARAKAVDEARKQATQANLALLGNYKGQITRTLLEQAVGAEKARQEAPEKKAAAERQARQDALAQQNAERQQRQLDRQNDIAQTNTQTDLATKFNSDPDIIGYRTASNNLKLANVAARQQNGIGDNALIRLYVRSTDDPRVASVVRESEAEGVQASVGLLAKAKVLPQRWVHGDLLNEEGRQGILKAMRETTSGLKPQYDQAYGQYRDRVLEFGKQSGLQLNPKNILREYTTPDDVTSTLEKDPQFQRLGNAK